MTRTLAAAFALGLLGAALPGPAFATAFCDLKETRDGFVALRAGPSPKAKLIAKLRGGDEVLRDEGRRGQWVKVRWWREGERLSKGFDKHAGMGWLNERLLGACG